METYLEGPIYLCIYLSIYLFIDWSRSVYRDPRGYPRCTSFARVCDCVIGVIASRSLSCLDPISLSLSLSAWLCLVGLPALRQGAGVEEGGPLE